VSGGTKGAEEGTLAVMAGGEAADIERVRPYVLAMARRLTHMGPTGAGQTTKLCNQVIVGCAMAVLAEATRLAVNAGIDAKRLPEALAGGFADSIPLQLFVPRMAQGIHSPPMGHIATMLKDLDTVVDVARTRPARYLCRRWPRNCSGWRNRRTARRPMRSRSTSCRRTKPVETAGYPMPDLLLIG
jgi:3-hydroxyisobutyrate dehydrogenase